MSGSTELTVNGGYNGSNGGIVSIPSGFSGAVSVPGINQFLQQYLYDIAGSIVGGSFSLDNTDIAGGTGTLISGSGAGLFQEFTNTDSGGNASSVTASGSYTVLGGTTDLAVQAPGDETIQGNANTTVALFGANSNVNYSVTDPLAGKIFLAGGADSVTLYSTSTNNAESIYSAGNDTINLKGQGTDYVSVYGNAAVEIQDANANLVAEGSATTNIFWDGPNSGGTLNFINNSSAPAIIHIGLFSIGGSVYTDATHVTAYGGAGGGFFVGGAAGLNSLVGGTGVVTLVGGGTGDYLEANSSIGANKLFAGAGTETLVATSTTGANLFEVGLNYPGLGAPAGSGVISTQGSGTQTFFLGNSPGENIYASTNTGANYNTFDFVNDATAGGGTFNIYNFASGSSHSVIFLEDAAGTGPGSASIVGMGVNQFHPSDYTIALSDGTTINLKNFSGTLNVATVTGGITELF